MKMGVALRLSVLMAVIAFACGTAVGDPDQPRNDTVVDCNGEVYTANDPFAVSLSYVLQDLINRTPSSTDYDCYSTSPYPDAVAYAHATCNKNLTPPDCAACLVSAQGQCQNHIGARVVLPDCATRYEQYPFDESAKTQP